MEQDKIRQQIKTLLTSENLAVLATQNIERPYTSLVAFSFSENLKEIFFVTARATQKYNNLIGHPQVALLVDNRKNTTDDLRDAVATTIIGHADELDKATHQADATFLLNRHPQLRPFFDQESTAFFAVHVSSYIYVCNFGDVTEYHP
ncbi:MAG: pyridoxamine 5'-phosphate oxidase family protein [Bacteroidia bacterium]|nr:pyridoxamine 5'-phosphate oxidase family protein [Bacteroidia bacterium]